MDVKAVYHQLQKEFGHQGWWPLNGEYHIAYAELEAHRTPFRDPYFEIAIGAILTQNVAWNNVAKAITGLYGAQALTPERLLGLEAEKLQEFIRPAGYFRQKAKKLHIFSRWLVENHRGDMAQLKNIFHLVSRASLLQLWGIGPETADSILLYALNKPVFVIDEYTRRLCGRHGVEFKTYDEYRLFFESAFKGTRNKSVVFQEYHALIVAWGKIAGPSQTPPAH